jgi:hypothetical protein
MGLFSKLRDMKDLGALALHLRSIWYNKPAVTEEMLRESWDAIVEFMVGKGFLKPNFKEGGPDELES